MLQDRRSYSGESPFARLEFETVESELVFARPYRESLLNSVRQFSDEDLKTVEVDRSDVGYIRKARDFILRIAYEAVHGGQMLQYLRMAGVPGPRCGTRLWLPRLSDLSTLVASARAVFSMLKFAEAAYLVVLGPRTLVGKGARPASPSKDADPVISLTSRTGVGCDGPAASS